MTHSVHLPGSGYSVWLLGSYVHLQGLMRGRGSAQPQAAANALARPLKMPPTLWLGSGGL